MNSQFYISTNAEFFMDGPFDSEEQAISEGRSMWPAEKFFVGERGQYSPWSRDYIGELTELEACDVSDECGHGASDIWPPKLDPQSEQYKTANKQIAEIMAKLCGECSAFPIISSHAVDPD